MNKIRRTIYFLLIVFIPVILGWWLFVPLAILLVYLAKQPYEIIVAGAILDSLYYFGDGLLIEHSLTLFAFGLILLAWFLGDRIH